jgi:hypothetical protein
MDREGSWLGFPLAFMGIAFVAMLISIGFYWLILRKAGYQGVWALAMVVPGLNVIALAFFALAEWPIQREVRELRARAGAVPPPTP